jgi:hypothetical protein
MATLNQSQTGNFIFSIRLLVLDLEHFLSFPSSKHASNQKTCFIDHDIEHICKPTLLVDCLCKLFGAETAKQPTE